MKRYIKSTSINIPEVTKYYKVCPEIDDPEDVEELIELFAANGLEYIGSVCAKSRYADILDKAGIYYASLCRTSSGEYGIYAISDDKIYDITYKIADIMKRAKYDNSII